MALIRGRSDQLPIPRQRIKTSSISLQPRTFGPAVGKTREVRTTVTFSEADAPTPVLHRLGFRPSGYSVLSSYRSVGGAPGVPGLVYNDDPLSADSRSIVLKCTVAGTTAEILVR